MVQDAISTVLLCAWLGGMSSERKPGDVGRLLTLEEVGEIFGGTFSAAFPSPSSVRPSVQISLC